MACSREVNSSPPSAWPSRAVTESAVTTLYSETQLRAQLVYLEPGHSMHSGKDPVSGQSGDPRVGVSPRNEDSDLGTRVVVPFNGKTVGDILGRDAKCRRGVIWSKPSQADEAHTADRPSRYELGTEGGRQVPLNDLGIDPVVHE
jgi:hypothetical protein